MISKVDHCDDANLQVLLFGDEHSEAYQSTWEHVKDCQTCRARLDELSGSDAFDATFRAMVRHDDRLAISEPGATCTAESSVNLDFLSEPSQPDLLGRLGRYEIERVVGSGGMGIILKGFDTELNRPVAIKVLAKHLSHVGAARQRFAREARAAAAIIHEHVVPIHNVEADGETPFLVMQFIAGESLQERVDRDGALGVKEILRIGIQVAAGLQAAHQQGVVHRDVKPSNILLEGGVERAYVTDFGLAQTVDDASLTQTGIITGTPNYMSPEQATGKPVDARSDLFSLGSVLYFMATGRPPFRADKAMGVLNRICHDTQRTVWQVQPEIPDALSDLIDRLLKKQPSRRFASAGQVHQELQNLLFRLHAHRYGYGVSFKRTLRRRKRAVRNLAIFAAVGVCVLLGGVALQRFGDGEMPPAKSPTADPQYSSAIIYQASPQEADAWGNSIGQLQTELDKLQQSAASRSGEQVTEPDVWWRGQIDHLEAKLKHYESPLISQ